MTFFRDLRDFFNRERKWSLLLLFLLSFFAVNLFLEPRKTQEPPRSTVLQDLREAETQLKGKIDSAGGVRQYLNRNPRLMIAVNLFSVTLLLVLAWGIFLDGLWFLRPEWRLKIRAETLPSQASVWGMTTVLKVVLVFVLLTLASGFSLAFLKARVFQAVGHNFLSLLHTTISDLLIIGLVVYFIHRLGGHWRELGFRKILFWEDLKIGIAGYAAVLVPFILVLMGVAYAAYVFTYEPPPHPLVEIFLEEEERNPLLIIYSIFLACVAGPVLEEVFFRGFCYPAFKKRWGVAWGLVLSAAFFAVIHQSLFAFLPIFVLGVGLGYLYEKRGTLLPSIFLHVVHNGVFITYFFLAKSVLTGG